MLRSQPRSDDAAISPTGGSKDSAGSLVTVRNHREVRGRVLAGEGARQAARRRWERMEVQAVNVALVFSREGACRHSGAGWEGMRRWQVKGNRRLAGRGRCTHCWSGCSDGRK